MTSKRRLRAELAELRAAVTELAPTPARPNLPTSTPLREQIARALWASEEGARVDWDDTNDWWRQKYLHQADAVLPVLPQTCQCGATSSPCAHDEWLARHNARVTVHKTPGDPWGAWQWKVGADDEPALRWGACQNFSAAIHAGLSALEELAR